MSTQIDLIRDTFLEALSNLSDDQLFAMALAPYAEMQPSAVAA